jgi:leucyl aminopeptidase
MEIQFASGPLAAVQANWLLVPVPADGEWSARLQEFDDALGGTLKRLKEARDLSGKVGDLLTLPDTPKIGARKVLLYGVGDPAKGTIATVERSMMTAVRAASFKADQSVALDIDAVEFANVPRTDVARLAAMSLIVAPQGQDLYKAEKDRHPLQSASLATAAAATQEVKQAAAEGAILGQAINLTRELVNQHPGELYPESFADRAQKEAKSAGLACTIFDEVAIKGEKMGSLLGVAQGSERPPRLVVLKHAGGTNDAPWLGLCGKGVTFDSGGLSLKPSDSMKTMKGDMAGAATVLGAMTAISRLGVKANVIGVLGLVENMPSGTSYKLGDVLKARNGVTIEIHNTDAEGRLVLADVLNFTVDQGAVKLIDLATLTGSCVVALGTDIAGAFSNDQAWCDTVLANAKAMGEELWQMPMCDSFNEQLKSDVADVKNVGTRWGGAITAAKFLERFVSEKPWVHLDIAGPAFAESTKPHREGGGTGVFVRTLVETARKWK